MHKIPTFFVRDFAHDPRYVTRDVTPGCEWVPNGKGIATRKYDGTCVMHDGERWWARREVKREKTPPDGFVEVEADDATGNIVGWEPAEQSGFYKYLLESMPAWPLNGTHELCGPKINGNPEGFSSHILIAHDLAELLPNVPRDFDGLAAWLHAHSYEGIVWHWPLDGITKMVKIKKRDFPKP